MLLKSFVCENHEDFGSTGWRPLDNPTFDPLDGVGVAHDTLEHFANDDGTVMSEFMALGAACFVRGDGGWFEMNRAPQAADLSENIAADFPENFRFVLHNGAKFEAPAHTPRLHDKEMDTFFDRLAKLGCAEARGVLLDDYSTDEEIETYDEKFAGAEAIAAAWLKIGYQRAKRRYAKLMPEEVSFLFSKIQAQADKMLKFAEPGHSRIQVMVNLKECTFKIRDLNYGCYDSDWS